MNKKILMLTISLIICLVLLSIYKVDATIISFPLAGKTIYLDAGHGEEDNGTVVKNIKEKELNLQIVYKLKKQLETNGAKIYLTRTDDKDLSINNSKQRKKSDFNNRIKLINNSNADLYISIHQNYFYNSIYYGPQVFYVKNNKKLADIIQDELNNYTKTTRKTKLINNVYMYEKINKPGILIECGFLSNDNEREKLTTSLYQEELSKIITNGIIKYFNNNN